MSYGYTASLGEDSLPNHLLWLHMLFAPLGKMLHFFIIAKNYSASTFHTSM